MALFLMREDRQENLFLHAKSLLNVLKQRENKMHPKHCFADKT